MEIMSDKSIKQPFPQGVGGLPMKKDFVFDKETKGNKVTEPSLPFISLNNYECIPSNWIIETTDDEDLVRVILGSHDLVLTRQQFSKLLREGGYRKGEFNVKNTS
jgi:hypothetical protein